MTLWYLSFADDERFRGCTVVAADDALGAVHRSHVLGINPGGEVMIVEIPPESETEPLVVACLNRLVEEAEIRAHGGKKLGELPDHAREAIEREVRFDCGSH